MTVYAEVERPALEAAAPSWSERNQQWLVAAIGRLRARIEAMVEDPSLMGSPLEDCIVTGAAPGFTPALTRCAQAFGLTPFERELLLLVVGLELDQSLSAAVASLNADGAYAATFSLAFGILTQPHWDALSPNAPLRYWQLVAVDGTGPLMRARLRIDERILHFITGVSAEDPRLAGTVRRVTLPDGDSDAQESELAARIERALSSADQPGPLLVLDAETADITMAAHLALSAVGRVAGAALWVLASDLPAEGADLAALARRVDREGVLADALPILALDLAGAETTAASFAGHLRGPLLWLGPLAALRGLPEERRVLRFEVPAPDAEWTRAALAQRWQRASGRSPGGHEDESGMTAAIHAASVQFHLTPPVMDEIVERLEAVSPSRRALAVWPAARAAARGGLDALAQRVTSFAVLVDLVLPPAQLSLLHDLVAHLRHRDRVYREWGFGKLHPRGQGLVALFAGESGTGKTLAAEAVANALELDLYRIDLATLVSKYIGETEKNLKRVFDAAESSGAVLLFDEADALFGKRTETKDSHDRYANIEVAYLLQRLETYRGLAILTTNMKSALDRAFVRRIRFIVQFPFPDAAARERIWRREFPPAAPLGDVDFAALARLHLSGGSIHAIVLQAAFKAAAGTGLIGHSMLVEAARAEFARLERNFSEPSAGGTS